MTAKPWLAGTSLYRYYDDAGLLLYVGITRRATWRNDEHNEKEWWRFVARQEVEHYPDRARAHQAEKEWILRHRPPFNVQHNPDHADARQAYLLYRQIGGADALIRRVAPKRRLQLELTERLHRRLVLQSRFEDAWQVSLLDPDTSSPCIVVSGGRRAKILSVGLAKGRLRILVQTPDGELCRGAQLLVRIPGSQSAKFSMKQLELDFG